MKNYNSKRDKPGEYFPMPKATAYGKEATSQDSQTANEKSSMSIQRQENEFEETRQDDSREESKEKGSERHFSEPKWSR